MNKQYTVFSVHHMPTTVQATLPDNSTVDAIVDSLEVQLLPVGQGDGTIKLVYTNPDEIKAAEAAFVLESTINASFQGA